MLSVFIAFGIFLTLALFFEGVYYAYSTYSRRGRNLQQIKVRLQDWSAPEQQQTVTIVRSETLSDISWLDAWLKRWWHLGWFKRLHAQADTRTSVGVYLLLSGVCAAVGVALPILVRSSGWVSVGGGLIGGCLPVLMLYRLKKKRVDKFGRQFPEALDLMARALRAGHAFFVGMKLVGEECSDPIGTEFKRASEEISMGIAVPEALRNLAHRVDCQDLHFFVTAISVQRETGGNLAEIIELLSSVIRKRFQLYEKIKALSAEGKFSAYLLFGLPFAIGILIQAGNPTYMAELFTDPLGHTLLAVGASLMTLGALITKKMISMKV